MHILRYLHRAPDGDRIEGFGVILGDMFVYILGLYVLSICLGIFGHILVYVRRELTPSKVVTGAFSQFSFQEQIQDMERNIPILHLLVLSRELPLHQFLLHGR